MFGRQNRESIEKLIEQVQQMRDQAPGEAIAFRRECEEILKAAGEMLSKWILRDTDQLQNLQKRTVDLALLADSLTQLIRGAQGVAETVSRLRDSARNDQDSAFIITKCDEWLGIIQSLGRDIDQDRVLRMDELRLRDLQSVARNYTRALEFLAEAARLSRNLGPLDTALLKATLPSWREDFRNKGPSPQSLSELEKLLEPLQRKETERPQPPSRLPDEVMQLRRVFDELRAWVRVLNQRVSPVLEDSYRRLAQGDSLPAELQALRDTLEAEVARRRDFAAADRAARLQELRQDAGHYGRFCGESQELNERLDGLARNPGDTPPNYEQWLIQYRNADLFFLGIAQTKEEALAQGLRVKTAELEQRRQALLERALTRDLRNKTVALGASVGELETATGQVAIREALRATDRIDKEITAIEAQAERDLAVFNERESRHQQEIEILRTAATTCDKSELAAVCSELMKRIQAENSKSNDLDEMNARLTQADEELNRYTQAFLRESLLALDQMFSYCREAHRAIATAVESLAVGPREPRFSAERPNLGTVTQIMQDYESWKARREYYSMRMQDLTAQVAQAINTGKDFLGQLVDKHGYLSPEQRHEAIELNRIMETVSSVPESGEEALPRFTALANLLDRYKTFVRFVEGEREDLQKAHTALKDRFSKFNAEEFKKLFPEAAERVSALIFGVDPQHPCGSIRKQIELAFASLESLETLARRLVAQEMEIACTEAEIRLRASQNQRDEQLRSALDEVREYSPEQLAPAPVRRRLLEHLGQKKGGEDRA